MPAHEVSEKFLPMYAEGFKEGSKLKGGATADQKL